MALSVIRFLATGGNNGGTEYRNRITGQRYSVEPCGEGVMLYRGNRPMHGFEMPRADALALIELDDFPRAA